MAILPTRLPAGSVDPNSNQSGASRHGSSGDQTRRGEFGSVILFDSNTLAATVRTERGRVLRGVPCLRATPGEVSALPVGTEVAISYEYGPPVITGCISLPSTKNEGTPAISITDAEGFGGQGFNQAPFSEGNYRKPGEPTDLIPGDWAQFNKDGNGVAVLGGGTTILKGSPLAQIRAHSINDLVEIFSRNFRHITDMGESQITNEDGKINWSFRGGVTQRTETGPDEERWTIRADLGAVGDVFNFELTTPKGQTLFKFHVDASGRCEIFGINGVNIDSGDRYNGEHSENHTGNSKKTIGKNETKSIGGTAEHSYGGTFRENISGDQETLVNNDLNIAAMRDVKIAAGRGLNVSVTGPLPPVPLIQDAAVIDIASGNLSINVGTAQPLPPTTCNYNLSVASGDITQEIVTLGNISNSALLGKITNSSLQHIIDTTSIPNSIVLGGPSIISHLVKWEELKLYVEQLHALFDSHVHTITNTATAGPFPVNGITTPYGVTPIMSTVLPPSFLLTKSLVAGVTL